MITLYTWTTPNGQKPAILLEELGLSYEIEPINIGAGQQRSESYSRINPNQKIPALRDGELTVFESGAILVHLGESHGRFLAPQGQARLDALAWTFWQAGGLGPMIGQWGHFLNAQEKLPYAIERYLSETLRHFEVLEQRLSSVPFLAGEEYSIADIMAYPWAKGGLAGLERAAADRLPELPATRAWIDQIASRPAVTGALERLAAATRQ